MKYIKLFEDFQSYSSTSWIVNPKIIEDITLDLTDKGFNVSTTGLQPGNFIFISIDNTNFDEDELNELNTFKFSEIEDTIKFIIDYFTNDNNFRVYKIEYSTRDRDIRLTQSDNYLEELEKISNKDICKFEIELAKN